MKVFAAMLALVGLLFSFQVHPAKPNNVHPIAAAAYSSSTTFVEDHTGSAWPVREAVAFVDQYTGSHDVYGHCRAGYRCVRIYESNSRAGWCGLSWAPDWNKIAVSNYCGGYPRTTREVIVAHELFHTLTRTGFHSTVCNNIMYPRVGCNGRFVPLRFSLTEQNYLRAHG